MKNKLSKILITILLILISLVAIQKSYADSELVLESTDPSVKEEKAHAWINPKTTPTSGAMTQNAEFTFTDLKTRIDILCSQRGQHIPSKTQVDNYFLVGFKNGEETETIGSSTDDSGTIKDKDFIDEYLGDGKTTTTQESWEGQLWSNESAAKYNSSDLIIAKPCEAYVLNEIENNTGSYFSYVQRSLVVYTDTA